MCLSRRRNRNQCLSNKSLHHNFSSKHILNSSLSWLSPAFIRRDHSTPIVLNNNSPWACRLQLSPLQLHYSSRQPALRHRLRYYIFCALKIHFHK